MFLLTKTEDTWNTDRKKKGRFFFSKEELKYILYDMPQKTMRAVYTSSRNCVLNLDIPSHVYYSIQIQSHSRLPSTLRMKT